MKEKIKRGSDRVAIQKMDEFNQTDVSGGYLLVLSSNSHDSMLATGEPQKAKVLDEIILKFKSMHKAVAIVRNSIVSKSRLQQAL